MRLISRLRYAIESRSLTIVLREERTRCIYKAIAKVEAQRIRRFLDHGRGQFIVVYDPRLSPPTIGDFLYTVFLCRYLANVGSDVRLIMPAGEYRRGWDVEDNSVIQPGRFRLGNVTHSQVAGAFLTGFSCKFEIVERDVFRRVLESPRNDVLVVFEDLLREGERTEWHCWNLVNALMAKSNPEVVDAVLLNKEQETIYKVEHPPNFLYVAWSIKAVSTEPDRGRKNTSEKQFIDEYAEIRRLHPYLKIMVVSDEDGCMSAKRWSEKYGLDLVVSKDYGNTFLSDAALVLRSSGYFQWRGGGMSAVAMFSKLDCQIQVRRGWEVSWQGDQETCWQGKNQIIKFFPRYKPISE